ncbi:MAG: non-canonical purine NTP pyrophosphatase [Candidatus Heimdallarchaeota archaeon]
MSKESSITFVTNNQEKIADIRLMLGETINLNFVSAIELLEIQSLSVEAVVISKAKQAYEKLGKPVAVSDSGLEITSLNKFPGALVKFANETIGQDGLVKLLEGKTNRKAYFVAAIAYCSSQEDVVVFVEKDEGTIAEKPRGEGWHFDRIFIPEGETQTWAEIGRKNKNTHSAFRRALTNMSEYVKKRASLND